ncbi:hypothetical protein FFLO_02782 [Filobasidium floriforme]|uniref:DUF423-domain-containing protein n=1 Tax=Filobasidium floriforme TaxID=5210 RepID=A0A8K0JNI1_9TREE|nr:hypothetical protein FFLO_02782 [Filobasidium floriforme]
MPFVNPSIIWRTGALFTASGIITGAFGSHALKSRYPDLSPFSVQSWSTASQYLIFNGVSLLAISLHPRFGTARGRLAFPSMAIAAGTLMFSGSIFPLVLARQKMGKFLGPVTPLGGSVMILGYLSMVVL